MHRRPSHLAVLLGALALGVLALTAQTHDREKSLLDSDRDGLTDEDEAALLAKFSPTFMISRDDCSLRPAQFVPQEKIPTVLVEDGTIYGQASPRSGHPREVELHYYHLWRKDCGEMGHRLDTEHVSAVITLQPNINDSTATYWYAAAHEDTICDASQLTRAETIRARDHGATVWISQGKHASFLSELLCTHGCGGDRCDRMEPLHIKQIINLGEEGAPMNEIAWLASPEWPLHDKMVRTDFPEFRIARVRKLAGTDVVWANPSKRPAQAAIWGANAGIGGAATGARATDNGLADAHSNTASALDLGAEKTGSAIESSSKTVWKALKKSVQKTGQVIDGKPKEGAPK